MIHTAVEDVEIVKSSNLAELFALPRPPLSLGQEESKPSGPTEEEGRQPFVPDGIGTKADSSVRGRLVWKEGTWNLELI